MNAGNPIYLLNQTTSEYQCCSGSIAQYLPNAGLACYSHISSGSSHEKYTVQPTRQSPHDDPYPRRKFFL